MLEGPKLLDEALAAGADVEAVYTADEALPAVERARASGVPVHRLATGVVERIADTVTPQPALAVARQPHLDDLDALCRATLLVVCVDVRDPGNAGTVLRSAEAAGADGVVCCDGSVDVYNPKTVRASAGSLFHVPLVVGGDAVDVLERIGQWRVRRLGTVARGGQPYTRVDLAAPVALVLGNEANGLPDHVRPHLDEAVTIPMAGRSESLNVGMAAAVLCFEAARQRGEAAR